MLMCRRVSRRLIFEATLDVLGGLCRSRGGLGAGPRRSGIAGIVIDAIGVQLVSHIALPRQSACQVIPALIQA